MGPLEICCKVPSNLPRSSWRISRSHSRVVSMYSSISSKRRFKVKFCDIYSFIFWHTNLSISDSAMVSLQILQRYRELCHVFFHSMILISSRLPQVQSGNSIFLVTRWSYRLHWRLWWSMAYVYSHLQRDLLSGPLIMVGSERACMVDISECQPHPQDE